VQGLTRESAASSRRAGLAATQSINIKHLRPVVLAHPYNGFTYEGIAASRDPDTAIWTSFDEPVNVRFILARNANMTDIVITLTDPPQSIVLPRLGSGDYYWRIQARIVEGADISSEVSHFRVLPLPLLDAPQIRAPADNFTIGPAQIRNSRAVNFSWNPVQGANSYKLTIFQGSGRNRRTVYESPAITETGYTVDDISLIGRGNFTWQVEALFMDNEFIERRGNLREIRLNIDIPSPSRIQTRDSGVLYGR